MYDDDDDDQPGAAGGFDLGSLFGMANEMLAAQQAAASESVVGSAGGGLVQITLTGAGECTAVRLAPEVVDPADIGMLEDLIVAAFRDAMAQVQQVQSGAMGGLDLGSLSGLLGGLGPAGGDDDDELDDDRFAPDDRRP